MNRRTIRQKKKFTKDALIGKLHLELDVSNERAHEIVNTFIDVLTDGLMSLKPGENLELRGFGTFKSKEYKARVGRNPKTQEPAIIPARTRITFRSGKRLRTRGEA